MHRFLTILLLLVSTVSFAQKVSNVKSSLEGDEFYTVTYHLDRDAADVKLSVSLDGGKTFSKPLKEVYGDVGKVPAGNHTIYWNIKSEMENAAGSKLVFKVSSEVSSACSEQIKLQSVSPKPSSKKDYSSSMTRVGPKVLFQFEVHGGMGLNIWHTDAAAPVEYCTGILIRGKKRGNFIGVTLGCDVAQEVPYFLMEYRSCRNDIRGFWFGANLGVCLETMSDNSSGNWRQKSITLPAGHFLAGYNITKWLNFRLAVGFPDLVSGSLAINIPNMFYKLR